MYADDFRFGKNNSKINLTQDFRTEPHGLATSRDYALDHSTISNRRIKSDIRIDEDPVYQYKCPTYKNYKTTKRGQKFNNKENQPMIFGNA